MQTTPSSYFDALVGKIITGPAFNRRMHARASNSPFRRALKSLEASVFKEATAVLLTPLHAPGSSLMVLLRAEKTEKTTEPRSDDHGEEIAIAAGATG